MSLTRSGALALILALVCGLTAQAQHVDFSTIAQAPPSLPLGEGVKVGDRVEIELKSGSALLMRHFTAIVGETENAWQVESNQLTAGFSSMRGGKGLVMAMTVDKKTSKVRSAKIGVPGGELKQIKIMDDKNFPKPHVKPAGKQEEFTLPSGKKVMATVITGKSAGQTYTSWVGAKGTDFEGLLLAFKGANSNKVLSADPREVNYELQDKGADGKPRILMGQEVAYTDGVCVVMSRDPIAKRMCQGLLSSKSTAGELKVVSLRTDATKTLNWK
tara:strand:+ start:148 stop:966 length:819 start_codon:yes stop_codon:yes gene_type:complete